LRLSRTGAQAILAAEHGIKRFAAPIVGAAGQDSRTIISSFEHGLPALQSIIDRAPQGSGRNFASSASISFTVGSRKVLLTSFFARAFIFNRCKDLYSGKSRSTMKSVLMKGSLRTS
jgi:hypothetical protein